MIKSHKIRINPTSEQEAQLWQAAHNARFTFNWGLARWNEIYEAGGKPTINFIKKELTGLKRKDLPWLLVSSKSVVEYALMDLKTAYKNFFAGTAERPRFKSRRKATPAFGLANDRIRLDDHNLKIQKIKGWIDMTETLRFEGKLMSVRFSFRAGWWWASFSVDVPHQTLVSDVQAAGVLTVNLVGTGKQIGRCFEVVRNVFQYLYRIPIFDNCCVLVAASTPSPVLADQRVFIFEDDKFDQIPLQKLRELYWSVKLYLDNWIAVRPDDEEGQSELQTLWDAYFACDEHRRASHRLEK